MKLLTLGKPCNAYFETPQEAAAWYDEKAVGFWGARAFTNFPSLTNEDLVP